MTEATAGPRILLAATALARRCLRIACGACRRATLCSPLVDETSAFHVTGGRHPVVEAALASARERDFIANDCDLADDQRLWWQRQTWRVNRPSSSERADYGAGSGRLFRAADDAHIGIVDRLFSRVGAADDLARGRSTFMVEMVETATILNQPPIGLVISMKSDAARRRSTACRSPGRHWSICTRSIGAARYSQPTSTN